MGERDATVATKHLQRFVEGLHSHNLHAPGLGPGIADLGLGNNHQRGSRLTRRHCFLRNTADLAHVAGAVDLTGDGHLRSAREIARREVIDDGERERESARRSADITRVDIDIHRELHPQLFGGRADTEVRATLRRPLGAATLVTATVCESPPRRTTTANVVPAGFACTI